MLDERIRQARDEFDLTDPDHQVSVVALAEALLADGVRTGPVDPQSPIEARIAGLLADSRRWLSQQTSPLTIGVVFAMWGEQNRLRPRSTENPHGEDSLATKLRQLDWAMRDTPIDWRVYAVDDGCPHGSAPIAAEIAHAHPLGDRVTVLSLADHLPAPSGPLRHLESPEASRKGGAITLGALRAIDDGADAVVYTDADSSVHLGQLGLLLRPFLREGAEVVLGSRKHPAAVLVKDSARWGIGIKVLRHMQRMVGKAIFSRGILDTQAAFKLYESGALRRILADARIFDFSFDTDWILAALQKGYTIEQVAFAFIDSAAESASIAQGPMTTWESLLFGLVRAVRSRGFATGDAAAMAAVIEEEIDGFRDLERIIDRLPRELADAEETDFGDPEIMSPEALRAWLRTVGTGG
jgi:hypothetical protein